MATLLIMALKQESQMLFENGNLRPFYSGVGQVKAAFATHKLILEQRPSRVVNLGTAGSFSLPQGGLVECTTFVQRRPHPSVFPPAKTLTVDGITALPKVVCGTGDYIEQKASLVPCDITDMEAYAMAHVCQQLGVAFTSIKYISDSSDENVLHDWTSHLGRSSQKLFDQYLQLTKTGHI